MAKFTAMLSLLAAFFGILAPVSGVEIPGGIVALTGDKMFLYYDFKENKADCPCDELKGVIIDGPFAVAENGKTFAWVSGSNFLIKESYNKDITAMANGVRLGNMIRTPEKAVFIVPQNTIGLGLSPDGKKFCYQFMGQGTTYVSVPYGHILERTWTANAGTLIKDYLGAPLFTKELSPCVRIVSTKLDHTVNISVPGDKIITSIFLRTYDMLGNTAEVPPVTHGIRTIGNDGAKVETSTGTREYYAPGLTLPLSEIPKRFGQRRDAHFGCWSKDSQLFAAIYQTANGWGPIELRGPQIEFQSTQKDGKPGIYEIACILPNCQGMAFKPDGTLTVLCNGRLGAYNGREIKQCIAGSGIAPSPNPSYGIILARGNRPIVPTRSVFPLRPALVADKISAPFFWATNDILIFRNADGELRFWDNGVTDTILPKVPTQFFYCNPASSGFTGDVAVAEEKNADDLEKNNAGDKPVCRKNKARTGVFLKIDDLRLEWKSSETDVKSDKKPYVHVCPNDLSVECSIHKDGEDNLEDMVNPVDPSRRYFSYAKDSHNASIASGTSRAYFDLKINEPKIFKKGGIYVAVVVTKLEEKRIESHRYSSAEKKRWVEKKYRYGQMVYEAKYWPPAVIERLKKGVFTDEEKQRMEAVDAKIKERAKAVGPLAQRDGVAADSQVAKK